jgi:hypothetical protein
MQMLRLGLAAIFRLAFFGALKLALNIYILTLSDAVLADAPKRDGHTGTTPPFADSNGQLHTAATLIWNFFKGPAQLKS